MHACKQQQPNSSPTAAHKAAGDGRRSRQCCPRQRRSAGRAAARVAAQRPLAEGREERPRSGRRPPAAAIVGGQQQQSCGSGRAAVSAAAARLWEREASCEFTPEGVFAYALSLRQERSSGTRVGTVTAKEVAAFFSTEGAPKRASNSIIRTALACLEKVPPPAAVFQEQKEALNRALAELDAIRVSKSSCRQGECLGEMEPSLAAGDGASAIPNNSNTHTSFGAWSPVHARARRADRVAR